MGKGGPAIQMMEGGESGLHPPPGVCVLSDTNPVCFRCARLLSLSLLHRFDVEAELVSR